MRGDTKIRRNGGGSGGIGKRKVRFAVIGQGYFAQAAVLPAFESAKDCELVAIFSEDPTKLRALKRRYGVEHALEYDQYDEFMRSGAVDAVYIALPNDMHCDYTVRAARAGVHVLCEKPMAVTSAEAERMIAACAENKVKLMIAYRLHFEEANLSAVELVADGRIGEPRFFSSTFAMQVKKENIRTKRARGGGPLHDIGTYCVNAARYLFRAEPTEVVAVSATRKGDPRFREIDEQVSAILRFPDDRLAQFTCSFGAFDHSSFTVVGTKGRLRLDPAYEFAGDLKLQVEAGGKTKEKTFKKRDQVAPELIEFAACLQQGREPEPSGREGLADLRVLEAIMRAAQSGQRVAIAPVERKRRPSLRQQRKAPGHRMPDLVDAEPPGQE
jgi:predicted dehydrogenase